MNLITYGNNADTLIMSVSHIPSVVKLSSSSPHLSNHSTQKDPTIFSLFLNLRSEVLSVNANR